MVRRSASIRERSGVPEAARDHYSARSISDRNLMALAIASEQTRSTDTRTFNGDGCPTEWLLEKEAEAKGIPEVPKYFYVFGNVVHGMIDTDIKTGHCIDSVEFWVESWFDVNKHIMNADWVETKNGRKADFVQKIWETYEKWSSQYDEIYDGWKDDGTEVELSATTQYGDKITSTVDAVMVDDEGRAHVIDWKVGTSKSGKDMQLYVYWYLMRKNFIVMPDEWFRGHFHYVNYSNPIGYTATGKYPGDEFIEEYIRTSEINRKQGAYLPNPSWFSCNYCGHKDECPLFADNPAQAWEDIKNIQVMFV